jgi:small subunit ribosomal protein S1
MSEDTTTSAPNSPDALVKGMSLKGTVKHIELYGALVNIGRETDALLHISQLGKANVRNVEDVVKVGDEIDVFVLKVEDGRVALSLVKPPTVDWDVLKAEQILTGTVVRIEKFGAFVDIGAERPGMVHISELADGFVRQPSDVVSTGQEVQVRVLKVNKRKRQIDLSMKTAEEEEELIIEEEEEEEALPTAMELAFRKAQERQQGDSDDDTEEKAKRKSHKRSEQQDDIIARTLRHHSTTS